MDFKVVNWNYFHANSDVQQHSSSQYFYLRLLVIFPFVDVKVRLPINFFYI